MWIRFLLVALTFASATAIAGEDVAPNAIFEKPATQLQFSGLDDFAQSKRVILPTLYVRMLAGGNVWTADAAGKETSQVRARFEVDGIDKTLAQNLAKLLYADLADRLRRAGFQVLTFDDVKGNRYFSNLPRHAIESRAGMRIENDRLGTSYFVVAPSDDMDFSDNPLASTVRMFREGAHDLKANVIVPTFCFDAPAIWAQIERGYRRDAVSVKALPAMSLPPGVMRIEFVTAGGDTGSIRNAGRIANIAPSVGSLYERREELPGDPALKALNVLGGLLGGPIHVYQFRIDREAYAAGALKGGVAFNDMVAKVAAKHQAR
jgi:hypothetical protein